MCKNANFHKLDLGSYVDLMMTKAQELPKILCLRKGGDESYLNHSTFQGVEIRVI